MKRGILCFTSFILFLGWTNCTNSPTSKKTVDSNSGISSSVPKVLTTADSNVDVVFDYHNLDSTQKKAWLLVPGQSAGFIRLDENADSVFLRFGKPDGGDAAMQKAIAIWYTNHDSTEHSTAIYTSREPGVDPVARIKQIRITSPSFQTVAGIHTGSTLKEIEAAYPVQKTETYPDAGTQYQVFDSKKGIAFEVQPDGSCVAIILHQVGTVNEGTYQKFRTTNKFISGKKE